MNGTINVELKYVFDFCQNDYKNLNTDCTNLCRKIRFY
jgi:hypothetical protein